MRGAFAIRSDDSVVEAAHVDMGEPPAPPPRRSFRVSPGTQVAVGDKLYGEGKEFSVEPEFYLEANSWVRNGYAVETEPQQKNKAGRGRAPFKATRAVRPPKASPIAPDSRKPR